MPDVSALRSVHLVGIGGAGMSGLARLFLARGVSVGGSDLKQSAGIERLRELGARVAVGHDASLVEGVDAVVVSSAIPPTNPEVERARALGIAVLARAQALAGLLADRDTLAVAGTHGKTTTTSMAAVVLERAGLDPTYVIGGDLNESGSNARAGGGRIAVAEADESDGSFLLLTPAIGIVTNVEVDHVDFYPGGAQEVEAAFRAFCERCTVVVACAEDAGVRRVVAGLGNVVTYGTAGEADVRVELSGEPGRARVVLDGSAVELSLPIPGRHNLLNAAAVLAAAARVGVAPADGAASLAGFTGVRRRFESRAEAGGARFVDDYAHHPTEIAATLAAARDRSSARLVAVFQPHRYSRTEAMWAALGRSLAGADVVVVTDVYGAGEQPIPGVTGHLVVESLLEEAPSKRVAYLPRRHDLSAYLAREVRAGDLVLTLGAGDITTLGDEVAQRLREELP